jgi:cbb3-type cytochrome oxidase subunit 3
LVSAFLFDPVFLTAVFVFIGLVAYVYWFARKEKERALKERLKQMEEKQEEENSANEK